MEAIRQFIWPASTICSSQCILGNSTTNTANPTIVHGWNHNGCVECVPWGGNGQLSPFTAALFAAASFGGAEYCYSGFWVLCGIKGGTFFVVICGAIVYRLQIIPDEGDKSCSSILLHVILLVLAVALLAWDALDVLAILGVLGREDGWSLSREACGKPFLNSTSVLESLAAQPFGSGWFVDELKHCASRLDTVGNLSMCCKSE